MKFKYMNCIFCKIVTGEASSHKVYEDEDTMVFLDIFPVSKGHVLVIPKEHYESLTDIPNDVLSKVWIVASSIGKVYRIKFKAPGVNIVTNSGRAAGQEVFHFHVHVIPRWGVWRGFWSGRHRLTPEEAEEVLKMWEKEREYLEELLRGG